MDPAIYDARHSEYEIWEHFPSRYSILVLCYFENPKKLNIPDYKPEWLNIPNGCPYQCNGPWLRHKNYPQMLISMPHSHTVKTDKLSEIISHSDMTGRF